MPFEVEAAPIPSWEKPGEAGRVGTLGAEPEGALSSAVPKSHGLDAAFLCRTHRTIAWFGGLATVMVALATGSGGHAATAAFASGLALGWVLLGTQAFLVERGLGGRNARERSRKMLWWLLAPLKYLLVALLLGWLLKSARMSAPWLALGFGMVQGVMFCKVVGRVLSGSVRTVRQAYVRPGAD